MEVLSWRMEVSPELLSGESLDGKAPSRPSEANADCGMLGSLHAGLCGKPQMSAVSAVLKHGACVWGPQQPAGRKRRGPGTVVPGTGS